MGISASLLVLTALSPSAPADITPMSLAIRPGVVDLSGAPYDWKSQQGGGASGMRLAQTANCNTVQSYTQSSNGGDTIPDCGFD